MSNEDRYIQNYLNLNNYIADYWLEVPYNEYGSRGFADAVFAWEPRGADEQQFYEIVEVKSETAIREATGANEIIRQVQKMAAYFIDGQEDDIVDTEHHRFRLDIIDTEFNRKHLLDNYQLYQSIHDENLELTPGISVNLVSQEGQKKTSLHNLKEWIEDDSELPLDLRNPNRPSPISLLDERKEPEDEVFCHRHGRQKLSFKPVFKIGGQHYVAKEGYQLFYCPTCLLEVFSLDSDNPFEVVHELGGMQAAALQMMAAPAIKSGDMEDIPGSEKIWREIDSPEAASNHTLK
uniref:hypothetical protein n=1 Tax=Halobacterium sp. (strain GN101) TaxID=88773 RepID=UPI00159EC0E3|nr:hypothetical protein [Halobacterium sp. GN101]